MISREWRMALMETSYKLKGWSGESLVVSTRLPYVWADVSTKIKERPQLGSENDNRLHNMKIAIQSISGTLVPTGKVFRFWNLVPKPEADSGFLSGPSLFRGKLKSDFGGGLCQVSTTLFLAFLNANFKILERKSHSVDVHGEARFFTLGQDAAVAWGYKDLIVKNQCDAQLQVVLDLNEEDRVLRALVLSNVVRPFDVTLESKSLETAPGAWRVKTRRKVDGKVNYHALDFYRPNEPDQFPSLLPSGLVPART